jgi:hypothetical protein
VYVRFICGSEYGPPVADEESPDDTEPFDEELLLEMYGTLQDQTQAIMDQSQGRLRGGVTAVVAVFGYAILGQEPRLYAVLPFVIGGLVIVHLESTATLARLNHRMSEIEGKLKDREPMFVWEREYGILADGGAVSVLGVDVDSVFFALVAVLVAAAYVATVWLGLTAWTPARVFAGGTGAVTVTASELLVVYIALSTGVLLALIATGAHVVRLVRTAS